ncbi:nucleotidyltransferase domain-containing protein [Candidatus Woesearchaeota archaeon]|jgi:predicted nucleotidyltransferase|nr:nucleotidyltransferase domain-containing protein [Candidatus Woesearchaeota archaeon]MBT4387151.1 nucleotidyltransferase domain-containing protein [Candidatus Woesearchaeota archaeon]MBT4596092.1 nucleotidyltransferase domain-containing protein [Candidatus Woesearchaeota archaeon]MBT5741686.1 nucleotidyltransferase domain-containing protein [Candidatus Woesearchaeota archaeon]MBT6505144.1 nucleotidyltransferase domain-containing protein [Candidatus Woesearchaeota archaeon]
MGLFSHLFGFDNNKSAYRLALNHLNSEIQYIKHSLENYIEKYPEKLKLINNKQWNLLIKFIDDEINNFGRNQKNILSAINKSRKDLFSQSHLDYIEEEYGQKEKEELEKLLLSLKKLHINLISQLDWLNTNNQKKLSDKEILKIKLLVKEEGNLIYNLSHTQCETLLKNTNEILLLEELKQKLEHISSLLPEERANAYKEFLKSKNKESIQFIISNRKEISQKRKIILNKIEEALISFQKKYSFVKGLILFGSFTRGKASPNDIDFFLVIDYKQGNFHYKIEENKKTLNNLSIEMAECITKYTNIPSETNKYTNPPLNPVDCSNEKVLFKTIQNHIKNIYWHFIGDESIKYKIKGILKQLKEKIE